MSPKSCFFKVIFVPFSFCTMAISSMALVHVPVKVAVIGAGISGLEVAYELKKNGFCVDVYEAQYRVGGRILSVEINGSITELGGHDLCDGGSAEHILDLIDELGLIIERLSLRRFMTQYFDGFAFIDIRERMKQLICAPDELWKKLIEYKKKAYSMQDVLYHVFPQDPLLREIFAIKLADYEGAPACRLSPFVIESLYKRLLTGMKMSNNDDQSETFEYMYVKGGNALITERLAERLNGSVHLGMALKNIKRDAQNVYHLTFQNGKECTADIVVFTIPCPTYKNIAIDSSVITPEHLAQITSVQYGTNAKIMLPAYGNHMNGVFTNGRMVCYLNEQTGIITAYYVNEHGVFTEDTINNHFQEDLRLLRSLYRLPHELPQAFVADISAQFLAYNGPVGHSWLNDLYAQGSYSCIGAGQEEWLTAMKLDQGEWVRVLFAPMHDNTIWFAGEHTTILLDYCGTMEAAVESGMRVARMIKQRWKLSLSATKELVDVAERERYTES